MKHYKNVHPKVMELVEVLGVDLVDPIQYDQVFHGVAGYSPKFDHIYAFDLDTDSGTVSTYILHEIVHWTGHESRLCRFTLAQIPYMSGEAIRLEEYIACCLGNLILPQ